MTEPSDEVKAEQARREAEEQAILDADIEHQKAMIADHNQKVDEANAIDWDAWEEETGLTRPEIPAKLDDPKT